MNLNTRTIKRLTGRFVAMETVDGSVSLGTLAIEGDEAVTRTGRKGRPIRVFAEDVASIVLAENYPGATVTFPVSLVKQPVAA